MNLPLIKLRGTPFEQGQSHGEQLRSQVHHNLQVYVDRFLREGGVPRQEVMERARRYAQSIAVSSRAYYDGMRGIALGAGLSLEEITALNVRYEILYYQYALKQMKLARDGCTAFALLPAKSANGNLWLGQNWDWIPDVRGAILHTTHQEGMQTLAFTEAGIFGGKIGMNSVGLGLAINGITTTADDWQRLSTPFHVRCYQILLQKNVPAARDVIANEPRACSANFLIAAIPDQAIDIEAAPDALNITAPQQHCLVHTNHFLAPEALGVEEPPDENRRFSCLRRDRLIGFLRQGHAIDRAQLQHWLQDHTNAPRSICRHENPDAPVDEQYRTVTSIVMDLAARTMWATAGPPCQYSYASYALRPEDDPSWSAAEEDRI